MEFPWSAVGVLFSLITLVVLLGYNIPKFIKYVYAPKITVLLYIYSKKPNHTRRRIQRVEDQTF
jgi:flagellar biogenesis protein FliO